jgi:uncharacterized membrane protein required for colicin V production
MGLDIALGVLVLLSAVRGWFRGFALQAMQIAALVGSIYVAAPLRDLVRPYARTYLQGMGPEILDRLLWWTAAVLSYLVMAGVGSGLVKMHKRRTYAEFEPNRGDQGMGFLVGALKGALVAMFLVAAVERRAPDYTAQGGLVADQVRTSKALVLSAQYRPAEQVWESAVVQSLVKVVKREGLGAPKDEPAAASDAGAGEAATAVAEPATAERVDRIGSRTSIEPLRSAAGRLPSLSLPALGPNDPGFLPWFDAELRREGIRGGSPKAQEAGSPGSGDRS